MSTASVLATPVNMWTSVLYYLLAFALLYYAVDGQFSFDAKLGKTASGTYVTHGPRAEDLSQDLQRIVETGSALLVLTLVIMRNASLVLSGLRRMWPFLALTVWAFASAAWSQDPFASIRNSIYLMMNLLMATYLVKRFAPVRQVQIVVLVGVIFTLLNLAIAVVLPRYGVSRNLSGAWSLEGICPHKNECAYMSLFLLSPLLFIKRIPGLPASFRNLYLALVTIVVLLTRSRTGWLLAVLLILLSTATKIMRRFDSKSALSLFFVASIPLSIGAYAAFQALPDILTLLGKDPSLHGRTPIWAEVFVSILKRPMAGYGFHAFWLGMRGESARVLASIPWDPNNAHHGFLEVWLEVGAIGLILVGWCIVRAIRAYALCRRHGNQEYLDWYLTIVMATVFLNIGEAELLGTINLGWTLFMIACLNLSLQSEKAKENGTWSVAEHHDERVPLGTG